MDDALAAALVGFPENLYNVHGAAINRLLVWTE